MQPIRQTRACPGQPVPFRMHTRSARRHVGTVFARRRPCGGLPVAAAACRILIRTRFDLEALL